jgi:Domain of unknown function (DUF4174)
VGSKLILILLFSFQQASFLDSYQWKKRVLLIFSTPENEAFFTKQIATVRLAMDEYKERDVVIFCVTKGKILDDKGNVFATILPKDEVNTLLSQQVGIILIGKDGGEKLRSIEPVSNEAIFGLIDSMPMRKSEVSKKY